MNLNEYIKELKEKSENKRLIDEEIAKKGKSNGMKLEETALLTIQAITEELTD